MRKLLIICALSFASLLAQGKKVALKNGVWIDEAPLSGSFETDTLALRVYFDSLGLKYRPLNQFLSGKHKIRVLTHWIQKKQRVTGLEFLQSSIAESGASVTVRFVPEMLPMIALKEIRLRDTDSEELPGFLAGFKNLEILEFKNAGLTIFPDSLTSLKKLRILNLEEDYLKALPDSLGNLSSLEELYLAGNVMPALPQRLGALKNLSKLSLPDSLQALPGEITFLNHLRLSLEPNDCHLYTGVADSLQSWMRERTNVMELGCPE